MDNLPISQLDPIGAGIYSGSENIFSSWLGPLPSLGRSDQYSQRNVSVWNLPEQYKGTSLVLRDTVEDLVFTAHQTYMTSVILPWYMTDQINMQWEQLEANAHLMDLTPYQTSSHAVTQKRKIGRAQLVRHGIMAEFELDFMRTIKGRAMFLVSVNQISLSIIETTNAEGVRALTMAGRSQAQFMRESGLSNDLIFKQYLDQDLARFAIVQKSKNGLEKLDMMISKEMEQYRGKADVFLIPEEVAIFATIVPPEKTDYYLAGPRGPENVNNTSALTRRGTGLEPTQALHTVRNTPVFIVKNMLLENVSEAESQQLSRYRQIGEYVTLLDDCNDYGKYRTDHRSILMYNQDIDDMTKITVEDCINNCGLWNNEGALRPASYDVGNKRDFEDDFLSFISPADKKTRFSPCEYLFDISSVYLSTKKVIAAGETLYASVLKRRGGAEINFGGPADDEILTVDQYNGFAATLLSIIGRDSSFSDGGTAPDDQLRSLTVPFADFAEVVDVRGSSKDGTPGTFVNSKVDGAFYKLLMTQVPQEKHEEVQAIFDGHGSALHKGEQVRGKLIEYVSSNVPGMKFKDEAPVHKWYEDRVKQYKELSASSQPVKSTGKIAGFMRRGLDLSGTNYRYLYPQSAQVATDALDALLPIHIAKCQAAVGARGHEEESESLHSSGRGMGLAGIGQFARDTSKERSKANETFNADRFIGFKNHLQAIENSSASAAVKLFARAYLMVKINKKNMLSLAENDVLVPMNFLVFRPHMQYRTRGLIKCKKGGETGITAMGNSNMMIESTATTKMARMHFTTHFRSIITQPRNVYLQPDVYVQESAGGAGCRFYDEESYRVMSNDNLENSLICVAVPITETIFPSPLDIAGRFTSNEGASIGSRGAYERLHYSSAARYVKLYDFLRGARAGMDVPTMGGVRNHVNRICYQGHQQNWNSTKGEFSKITPSRGHFGKNGSYAGAAPIRNGALEQFEKQNYSTRPSF